MSDLRCPATVVFAARGAPPALGAQRITRIYAAPEAEAEARKLAGDLDVGHTVRDGLTEPPAPPLARWLLDAHLDATAADGRTGTQVLARFAETVEDIADDHRGQAVAVLAGAAVLGLGLGALCAGLAPRHVCTHPLAPGMAVTAEYDADGWRCPAGWPTAGQPTAGRPTAGRPIAGDANPT